MEMMIAYVESGSVAIEIAFIGILVIGVVFELNKDLILNTKNTKVK